MVAQIHSNVDHTVEHLIDAQQVHFVQHHGATKPSRGQVLVVPRSGETAWKVGLDQHDTKVVARGSEPTLDEATQPDAGAIEWGKGQGQNVVAGALFHNRSCVGELAESPITARSPHATCLNSTKWKIGLGDLQHHFIDASRPSGVSCGPILDG